MVGLAMPIRYTVDLDAPLVMRRLPTLLMEEDSYANELQITVTRGGAAGYADGNEVLAFLTREDGAEVSIGGTVENDVVTVRLPPAAYTVEGQCVLQVKLVNQELTQVRTILLAAGRVEASGNGPIVDQTQQLPTLAELLGAADVATSAAARVPWLWSSNLLDNSFFARPVKLDDKTTWNGAANTYTIARWLKSTAAVVITLISNGVNIDNRGSTSANGHMTQRLERVPDGTYTLTAETNGGTLLRTFVLKNGALTQGTVTNAGSAFTAVGYSNGLLIVQIGAQTGAVVTVYSAALYPGEYSVVSKPAYMQKPVVIEETECMRYYQIRSTGNVPGVDMRPKMRIDNPTVTALSNGTYAYDANL